MFMIIYSRTCPERPHKGNDNYGLSWGVVSPQGPKAIEKYLFCDWGEIK